MRVQSFVVGSDEVEISLGTDDGGREYIFVRLPLPEEEFASHTLDELRLFMLRRVSDAIGAEMQRIDARVHDRV
jgi:hypothetical protein